MARILMLEDDSGVSEVFRQCLEKAGHETVVCHRFEDARTQLRMELPDAVLTDVRVGEFNGLQLALLFRSLSPGGTIVVVSGHADPVIIEEVRRLEGEFLLKPVDPKVLVARFKKPESTS